MVESMRLQKRLAEAGLCSRREGERWIEAGRVAVNGEIVTSQGVKVGSRDRIVVDGQPLRVSVTERLLVLAMNKPVGVLCSRKDPEGRTSVFNLLDSSLPRLIHVGRLDINSEGLLLFANDGQLVNSLCHPSNQVPRVYRARVRGRISQEVLQRLRGGALLEDGPTGPVEIELNKVSGANSWVTMTLREGRNRIIRKFFQYFDMEVSRLIRISYGGVELGDTPRGQWRILTAEEKNVLLASVRKYSPTKEGNAGMRMST